MSLQNNEDKIVSIFFSRDQLRFKQKTEGSRFSPKYVIIKGKKMQYTEKKNGTVTTIPFSDAILIYSGSESEVKYL